MQRSIFLKGIGFHFLINENKLLALQLMVRSLFCYSLISYIQKINLIIFLIVTSKKKRITEFDNHIFTKATLSIASLIIIKMIDYNFNVKHVIHFFKFQTLKLVSKLIFIFYNII